MEAENIKVKLIADLNRFTSNMQRASRTITGFGKTASKSLNLAHKAIGKLTSGLRRMVPAGLGLTGLSALIVKIGADAEEAENLFEVAFEGMAGDVRRWSEEVATQLKVSATGLRETAGTFQLFLTGLDVSADKAKDFSTALAEVAYDMASLRNLKFDDSLTKIQAALAGEVEPLRRLGVTVNDTTMKLWAQKRGLDDNTASWSEQQKVVARMGVIFEKLQRDMGDLNRTQDGTTNLLRSIKDQFRETAIAIYENWKVYIQASLKGIRDWLIRNRETIAEWAGKVAAYVVYAKDVFVSFVNTMRQSPKEGFSVLLRSLIEVMEAAAEIAIDLAIRIGKGIWQGVKEGVFGDGLEKEAQRIYKEAGGQMGLKFQSAGSFGGGLVPVPTDEGAYQDAMEQARSQRSKELTEPIMAGFGARAKATLQDLGNDVVSVSDTMAAGVEQAKERLNQSLAGIKGAADGAGDAMQEAGQEGAEGMDQAGDAADALTSRVGDLTQAWRDAGKSASQQSQEAAQAVQQYVQRLQQEVQVLALVAQGQTTAAARQQLVNDFKRQGIELTETQIQQIQRLEQAQAELENRIAKQDHDAAQWKSVWVNAAHSVNGAFEDAFVGITTGANSLRDVLSNLASSIQQTFARAMYQATIGRAVTSMVGSMFGAPMMMSRGGIVPQGYASGGLVYASSGMFTPRGTDTVPAMLTPGEGVLDKDLTARLRQTLQVPEPSPAASRPINISVSAIDAAGTYQFLQKNKRAIASMIGDSSRMNHPMRRNH